MTTIESALNPDYERKRVCSDSVHGHNRALSKREAVERSQAMAAQTESPDKQVTCTGNLFVGIFFDGTGNNRDADYLALPPAGRKHSNVVRLLHAYPDKWVGTNRYKAYYIQGVGTPFKEIGDTSWLGQKSGGAAGYKGEARIIWGLTRLFNEVHYYFARGANFIPEGEAKDLANDGFASSRGKLKQKLPTIAAFNKNPNTKPKLNLISLSVYGFSRGAAEARAFTNWLFQFCEYKDGTWTFADIPLCFQFLGLFDTVASVGMAPAFTVIDEGHSAWADKNLQIHPGVEQCLHFVAAHEVRACFPSDSTRIEGKYPSNTTEYVYPGVHSDVGGGYAPKQQGKLVDYSRVPGYDMYVAALAAGVPFYTLAELAKMNRQPVVDELLPNKAAIDGFQAYGRAAAVSAGPVEDMIYDHMSWYFSYQWQIGTDSNFKAKSFYQRARRDDPTMPEFLLDTHQALMNVLAKFGDLIQARMTYNSDKSPKEPLLDNPYVFELSTLSPVFDNLTIEAKRTLALVDDMQGGVAEKAARIINMVKQWRDWLAGKEKAETHDADAPERDLLWLVDSLTNKPIPKDIVNFFDNYVYDSMGGFAGGMMVREFLINGFGIAKFRRIYFGDRGDAMIREAVSKENRDAIANAKQDRINNAEDQKRDDEYFATHPSQF